MLHYSRGYMQPCVNINKENMHNLQYARKKLGGLLLLDKLSKNCKLEAKNAIM